MQAIPSPLDCSQQCIPSGTSSTPGPQGPAGAAGADGTNGVNAYTLSTTGTDVMPDEGDSVTVTTSSSTAWMAVGAIVYVQFWGWLRVTATPTSTSVTLLNIEDSGTGAYADNAAPGTVLPAGARIVPSGPQGVGGSTPADALLASANLSDVDDVGSSRDNLGLGTAAVLDTGVTNGLLPPIDTTFTSGDAVFATGTGLQTKTASDARTALGLGTLATQAASAVAITGGAIDGTQIGGTTPAQAEFTALTAGGATTLESTLFTPSSAVQLLAAGTTTLPNATKIKVAGNGAPATITATPSITAPASDGQLLLIQGNDDTNTVEYQDEGTLASSGLRLGATSRTLGKGDTLLLTWTAADSKWYEVNFTALV